MVNETVKSDQLFPIGELSSRTQVNTVTIRAWERRYGLLKPQRTAKGHRLYSDDDVQAIEKIIALVARGVPLGKVKPLLANDSGSENLAAEDAEDWQGSIDKLMITIELFSSSKTEQLFHNIFSSYPVNICCEKLIEPLFTQLSQTKGSGAAYGFAESEFVRYASIRLNGKNTKKNKGLPVTLIAGDSAPLWRLALMALALNDLEFSVLFLQRAFSLEAGVELAAKLSEAHTIFYQDGVFKTPEKQRVTIALMENQQLYMCGTAAIVSKVEAIDRIFPDVKSCIQALKQLSVQ